MKPDALDELGKKSHNSRLLTIQIIVYIVVFILFLFLTFAVNIYIGFFGIMVLFRSMYNKRNYFLWQRRANDS